MASVTAEAKPAEWDYLAQPKERVDRCCLCGQDQKRLITAVDRYRYPARFYLCNRCGMVWNTPRMTGAAYHEFYQSGAYREIAKRFNAANGADEQTQEATRRAYNAKALDAFAGVLASSKGGSLLDVGGSDGLFAAVVRDKAGLSRVAVLEPSLEESGAVPDGVEVYQGSSEDTVPPTTFDVVVCLQTVEHFQDPRKALENMRKYTGRFLLIDCINFPVLWFHLKHQVCKIDHPYNFHYQALRCLLYQTGFKPVDMVHRKDKPASFIAAVPAEPIPTKLPGPAFTAEVLRMFK